VGQVIFWKRQTQKRGGSVKRGRSRNGASAAERTDRSKGGTIRSKSDARTQQGGQEKCTWMCGEGGIKKRRWKKWGGGGKVIYVCTIVGRNT